MKKLLVLIMLVLLLTATQSYATNTTTIGTSQSVIEITVLDADWTWETDLAAQARVILNGRVQRIIFYPSAASDRMIIRDGGIDNAAYFDSGVVSGADDPRTVTYENPIHVNLVIDITDCTLSSASDAKVLIFLEMN